MARPIWWQASDVGSMAELLQKASKETVLDASPAPAPSDASTEMLHHAAVQVARLALSEAHSGRDRILMEEVKAVDDLLRASNLMIERLREWYGLHAPDITRAIDDAEQLASLVAEHGERAHVVAALDMADGMSIGTDLDPADLAVLQGFAAGLRGLHTSWRALENRIGDLMQEVAPNIHSVVGPNVGARLIALAGGLHRLGTMSAGTIQTLGAETALFRHIKEGTKPPKHGILFQHALVFQAPRHQRGAVSRALANHVALASRADATTGNDLRGMLGPSLESDLARIKTKVPKPRPEPSRGPKKGGHGGRGGKPFHKGKPGGKSGGTPDGKPGGKPPASSGGKPHGGPKRNGPPATKKTPRNPRLPGGGAAKPPGGRR